MSSSVAPLHVPQLDILDVKLDLDADRVTYTVLFIDGPEMVRMADA